MPKVLLIDDEMTILIVLRALFKASGFEPTIVQGGQPAADLIAAGGFDLMVSDVRMNPINGIEFLKQVKATHPRIPVIMITAFATEENKVEMKRLGAYGCLKKPFDNGEVIRLAKEALLGAA